MLARVYNCRVPNCSAGVRNVVMMQRYKKVAVYEVMKTCTALIAVGEGRAVHSRLIY